MAITSAAINNLYFNCGNVININFPENTQNINVTASSAAVLPNRADKRKYSIVPTAKTCDLKMNYSVNGKNVETTRKYKVIISPKPTVSVLVNGMEYNGLSPVSKRSNILVKLRPDADFMAALPRDARYEITKVDLLAQRSLGAPSKIGTFSGDGQDASKGISIPLGSRLGQDPPGTKIFISIDKVYRINFENKREEIRLSDLEKVVSFMIR